MKHKGRLTAKPSQGEPKEKRQVIVDCPKYHLRKQTTMGSSGGRKSSSRGGRDRI